MKPSLKTTMALGYLIVAVVTFGHSASHYRQDPATCVPAYEQTRCGMSQDQAAAWGAIFWAIFWPLYWSWEVQS